MLSCMLYLDTTGSFLELGLNKQTKKAPLNDQVKGLGRNSCSMFKDKLENYCSRAL